MGHNILMNMGFTRVGLIALLVTAAVIISQPSRASEEPEAIGKSMIQESVAMIACGDERFIDLSGLDYDACLSEAERIASNCWTDLELLLPDLGFGQSGFDDEANQDRVLSTMFALEKCIQASILLPPTESDISRYDRLRRSTREIDELTGARKSDAESDEQWTKIIATARAEHAEKRDLVSQISKALAADGLVSVTTDGRGGVLAFKKSENGSPVRVSEYLQSWKDVLADTNVQFATMRNEGVVLGVGPATSTDLHRIVIAYVSGYGETLPQCTPDFRHTRCGSCEIDRYVDSRAVLTWYSRDIENSGFREGLEGETFDMRDQMSVTMQCWKDGMSQLGFDVDPP